MNLALARRSVHMSRGLANVATSRLIWKFLPNSAGSLRNRRPQFSAWYRNVLPIFTVIQAAESRRFAYLVRMDACTLKCETPVREYRSKNMPSLRRREVAESELEECASAYVNWAGYWKLARVRRAPQ